MIFLIITNVAFVVLSGIIGIKKGGEGKIITLFLILELVDAIKYGWGVMLAILTVWNIILLIASINGITKAKGEMYLSEKYDEKHSED